ncbi:MAG: hypothetical protein M1823_004256 [Watsoniomyces obsoletus]|nr:MAG: hypothetical protein M1823_004256 [Watsoniomyces obsoletus]
MDSWHRVNPKLIEDTLKLPDGATTACRHCGQHTCQCLAVPDAHSSYLSTLLPPHQPCSPLMQMTAPIILEISESVMTQPGEGSDGRFPGPITLGPPESATLGITRKVGTAVKRPQRPSRLWLHSERAAEDKAGSSQYVVGG